VPWVGWSRVAGFSCCGAVGVSRFELDRSEHAKRRVPALAVVEDLQVLEDRGRELNAGVPAFAVEQLDPLNSAARTCPPAARVDVAHGPAR